MSKRLAYFFLLSSLVHSAIDHEGYRHLLYAQLASRVNRSGISFETIMSRSVHQLLITDKGRTLCFIELFSVVVL